MLLYEFFFILLGLSICKNLPELNMSMIIKCYIGLHQKKLYNPISKTSINWIPLSVCSPVLISCQCVKLFFKPWKRKVKYLKIVYMYMVLVPSFKLYLEIEKKRLFCWLYIALGKSTLWWYIRHLLKVE